MSHIIRSTKKQEFKGQFDVAVYVFCCMGCHWQVQGGYRARSDVGGARALLECFAEAHRQHLLEDHDDDIDVTIDWGDGTGHAAGTVNPDGSSQAALMAVRLPSWWVDR